jgi:hypothetical protein
MSELTPLQIWYAELERRLDHGRPEAQELAEELRLARQRYGDASAEVTRVLDKYGRLVGIGPCPPRGR